MGLILTQKRSLTERHEKAIRHALEAIKQSELSSYVEDVILYGSCARYEQRWSSDVDLCLVLKPSIKEVEGYRRLIHILKGTISEEEPASVEVDLKVLIGNKWENDHSLYCRNVRKDGISLWQ